MLKTRRIQNEKIIQTKPTAADTDTENEKIFAALLPLAMAYVPDEPFGTVYGESEGLSKGTVFPDLYFPFSGGTK